MESSVSPSAAFASIPMLFAIRFGVTTLFTIFFQTVCSFAFSAEFLPVSDFSTKFARVFVCRTCSWGMGSATVPTYLAYLVHVVQWCACAFLNFLSTCENGFKTSPHCKCVCQLVAFGFPSSSRWNASIGVDAIMSSVIVSSNSLSSNSHFRA